MTTIDTIWTTRCPVPTALSLAIARGELSTELAGRGIALRSLATSSDPQVHQAHFVQSVPNFIRHGGNTPPLVSASRGKRIRILGLSWGHAKEGFFALPGSGISRAADLRGKRISLPRQINDPVDFWRGSVLQGLRHALRLGGLSENDIVLVDVPIHRSYVSRATGGAGADQTLWGASFMLGHQREEATALLKGDVDVIFSQGSIASLTQGFTGAEQVVDLAAGLAPQERPGNATPLLLTATADLVEEHPDLAARILFHVLKASAQAAEDAAAVARIVGIESGLPEELSSDAWSDGFHAGLAVDFAADKLVALRAQAAFLQDRGFFEHPLDLEALLDPAPLEAARAALAEPAEV